MAQITVGTVLICVPLEIDSENEMVTVKADGIEHNHTISFNKLFSSGSSATYKTYPGSIVSRMPYDVIRVGHPITAVVTEVRPLRLSRTEYISIQWKTLEEACNNGSFVFAEITGRNKKNIFFALEYNVRATSSRQEFENYLKDYLKNDRLIHKYYPMEGDIVAAAVANASAKDYLVELDIVKPLRQMHCGQLDKEYLNLFGGDYTLKTKDISSRKCSLIHQPILPTALILDKSQQAEKFRDNSNVFVLDDDEVFREQLAWVLKEIGYNAFSLSPSEVLEDWPKSVFKENSFILLDVDMTPSGGIELANQLHNRGPWPKCILMSGHTLNDPLRIHNGLTLKVAAEDLIGQCPFWAKLDSNPNSGIQKLDSLLLDYGIHCTSSWDSTLSIQNTIHLPSRERAEIGSNERLLEILSEIRNHSGAHKTIVFSMDRNTWRADVIAGDDTLAEKSKQSGAQSYLPNSPIRDISFQRSPILFECDVQSNWSKYKNLLRFFRSKDFDEPFDDTFGFKSVAAIRIDIPTERRYSLFLFHPNSNAFDQNAIIPILEQAAERLELVLIKQLHEQQSHLKEPAYLEGLARAGLRHDARGQLADIQLCSNRANVELERNNKVEVNNQLKTINRLASEAHNRINKSLERLQPHLEDTNILLYEIINWASGIAQGVAARISPGPNVLIESNNDESFLRVSGKIRELQRVLENILVNAVEHGIPFVETGIRRALGIRVEILEESDTQYPISIHIFDNGPGIHSLDLSRIFDPMFSTKSDGYGMGLAIVKRVCESLGIVIEVKSSIILVGTQFTIRLPRTMVSS